MADMTFNCPHCQQPIQCDDQWSGQQIQCPLCQGALTVPPAAAGAPAAAAPAQADYGKQLVAPPSGNKLAFQHNAQAPATPRGNIPIRNLAGPAPKKKNPIVGYAIGAVVVIALAGGGYFGWNYYQDRAKAKALEEAKQATAAAKAAKQKEREEAAAQRAASGLPAANARKRPPAYTLDVTAAKIPQCAVNGTIGGSNFVAELVRVDAVGAAQVLRLTQGTTSAPEREFLIYLGLKPGDKLSGHTWTIASDQKGAGVPQVIKRWKVKAGFAPVTKAYASGYAMQLELGQVTNNMVPGKIFLALPDAEQSVAGGFFQAQTTLADVIPATGTPGVVPAPTAAPQTLPGASSRYNRPH